MAGIPRTTSEEIAPEVLREQEISQHGQNMASSNNYSKLIEQKERELRETILANYNRIKQVERELGQVQTQLLVNVGPRKHALEMLRNKIEKQNEKVGAVRQRYNAAKQVLTALEAELNKEEAVKEVLCGELNLLVQQSATSQLAKLEELKNHLEQLDRGVKDGPGSAASAAAAAAAREGIRQTQQAVESSMAEAQADMAMAAAAAGGAGRGASSSGAEMQHANSAGAAGHGPHGAHGAHGGHAARLSSSESAPVELEPAARGDGSNRGGWEAGGAGPAGSNGTHGGPRGGRGGATRMGKAADPSASGSGSGSGSGNGSGGQQQESDMSAAEQAEWEAQRRRAAEVAAAARARHLTINPSGGAASSAARSGGGSRAADGQAPVRSSAPKDSRFSGFDV